MPIVPSDIKLRMSTQSGAAGNSLASSPPASIGKYMSLTDVVDGVVGNLFSEFTRVEAETGKTVYRCAFMYNSHATDTWFNASLWILSQIYGGADLTMGLDPNGISDEDQAAAQAEAPADGITAPAGVVFSAATDESQALIVDDLEPGTCQAIWFKLVLRPDQPALALDNAIILFSGQIETEIP